MKSVTPIYFCISDTSNSLAIHVSSRSFIKLSMLEDFRVNVLKYTLLSYIFSHTCALRMNANGSLTWFRGMSDVDDTGKLVNNKLNQTAILETIFVYRSFIIKQPQMSL